jgi:hypothetical protein
METVTETATDRRVDELSKCLDRRFVDLDRRFGRIEDDIRELRSELRAEVRGFAVRSGSVTISCARSRHILE